MDLLLSVAEKPVLERNTSDVVTLTLVIGHGQVEQCRWNLLNEVLLIPPIMRIRNE